MLFACRSARRAEWNREVEQLASELASLRRPRRTLHEQEPEEWLASQSRPARCRGRVASPNPVYNQAPAWLGGQRGLIDLLAVDYSGGSRSWN